MDLPHSVAPRTSGAPGAAVLAIAAAVILVLVVRVGAGAIAASAVPATAISVRGGRGGRGAIPVPAASTATVSAVATVAVAAAAATLLGATAPSGRTHSPVTLILVHQVGVVRTGGATETGTATSSSASATSGVNQLQQLGIDGLPGLLQHPDQLAGLAEVPWREEGVGSAFIVAAGRTTNAVDVVLRRIGIVVIDDKLDILHVLTCEAAVWSQGRKRYRLKSELN